MDEPDDGGDDSEHETKTPETIEDSTATPGGTERPRLRRRKKQETTTQTHMDDDDDAREDNSPRISISRIHRLEPGSVHYYPKL